MATISSQGIGSGLDVSGIISKLMAVEQQPLTKLNTKEASYQAKLTAFGTLKGAFASLQSAALALKSPLLFNGMAATPSDTSVLSASANTAASAGNYTIDVVARAKGQTIASQSFNSLTNKIATADGKLKIELGTFANNAFTPSGTKPSVTIDISQANSTLGGIRDAINNANAGVTARIVDVGNNNYKLLISANGTGAAESLRITALDTSDVPLATDNTGLAKFSFDPVPPAAAGSGNEFDVTVAAQDAHIKINNLDIYRSTNSISDAITGVSLSLTKEGTSELTVAKNTSGISDAFDAFVKAYNGASQQVRQLSAYDSQTGTAAVLTGDNGARSLQTALSQMLYMSVDTGVSSPHNLSDLGIALQRDGTLKFDSTKLDSALKSNPTAVEQLVVKGNGSTTGIATRLTSLLNTLMDEHGGVLATSTDGINRSIKDLGKQRTQLQLRLAKVQSNYEQQFTAMDKFVASWNQTSTYLTQQLSALMGSSSSNSSNK